MSAATEVRARIDRFVSDLTTLIRSATVEAFDEALDAQRVVMRSTAVGTAPKKRVKAPARKRSRPTRANGAQAAAAQLSLPLE